MYYLDKSASTVWAKFNYLINISTQRFFLHLQTDHHLYQIHNQGATIPMSKIVLFFLTLMSYMNPRPLMIISVQKLLNMAQGHYL